MELINVVAAERGTYIKAEDSNHREIVIAWLHIVDTHEDHYVLCATAADMRVLNHHSIEVVAQMIRERMDTHDVVTAASR